MDLPCDKKILQAMSKQRNYCKVLSVEDDPDYQEALMNGLSALNYDGKEVEFLTASSASDAATVIAANPDISVIFLDVVMETDVAGLRLIRTIREVIGNDLVRIVLLTGQPGMAPVDDLIGQYDIDDYWCKSDLTQAHLQTIVLSNLRTWEHLSDMKEARYGMQLLLAASQRIASKSDITDYTHSILEEIGLLLKMNSGGIVCFFHPEEEHLEKALIVAACGEFSPHIHRYFLSAIQESVLKEAVELANKQKAHIFQDGFSVLYFSNKELEDREYMVVVKLDRHLASNEINLLQVFCENISAGFRNVALHNKLTELAYIEPTLGIHNKNWLVREIRNMFSWEREKATLLMLYVEDLAYTESVLGSKYCDKLTLSLYDYLSRFFDKAVDIALLERDTLVLIVYDDQNYNEASLENIIHTSIEVKNSSHSLDLTVSSVKFSDFPAYEAEQLVSVGKSTLERAKYEGVSYLAFSETLASAMFGRYELLQDLREAILNDEIRAYFQPKMNLKDNRLIGFEALARWTHKNGSNIPPDQFIALAESSGLIDKLDQQMLQQSCQAINTMKNIGINVPISVNVAGNEIIRPNYFEGFQKLLEEEGVPNEMIELEITESQFIEEKGNINKHLTALKTLGVRVNIDDFGTGYSSLAYLSTLSVSTLKIDHSFVWRMEESEKDWEILKMIIELGNSLGLSVIAEGIETEQQKAHLQALGCEDGQGYLFAKPMSLDETINWVQAGL
ncbi:diguanylate cyclase [Marinomonas sp. A3A]|uniref:bifunctional diguanylate cyclase/phosphodiesterase n=1 Tax=Marinomonas sp. A3A TaxID=2065312 RepID=UPI001BB3944A|nr:EAL domain-containing protein [Marinomonas sp. A3A]QUX89889.1 diguanylate cyclase [Marinomonas sp. A3A]